MSEELDRFLAGLRAEASVHSEGRFTLDPVRALQQLRNFRLHRSQDYVLNLVAAAVAGGARRILVEAPLAGFLTLAYDGRSYTQEELKNLFGSLFVSQADRSQLPVRELALGLVGAERLRPERWFYSYDSERGQGSRLELDPKSLVVGGLGRAPHGASGLHNLVCLRGPKPTGPELALVEERCRRHGLQVEVSGVPLAFPGEPGGFEVSLHSPSEESGHLLPKSRGRGIRVACSGDFSARLILDLSGDPAGSSQWWVVVNGVEFAGGDEPLIPLPGSVTVLAPYLAKDASQTQLVRNDEFAALLAEVELGLWEALARVLESGPEDLEVEWERLQATVLRGLGRRHGPTLLPRGPARAGRGRVGRLWNSAWVPLATGGRTSLARLADQYARMNYLPVAAETYLVKSSPTLVVLENPFTRSAWREVAARVRYAW